MITGTRMVERTESAYPYPLLLKQLLHTPIIYSPDQEIVYRDKKRFSYRELYARMKRLASGLQAIGVCPGDIVAVLDWDSYRYLESYFGVPGLGAVLHCVNVRLSPEQMLCTMKHAEDQVVLVHEDFIPLIEDIRAQMPFVKKWVLLKDSDREIQTTIPFECEYEELLIRGADDYEFPDFDENSMATLFYTTGTTGDPKGVFFSHRQLVLHTLAMLVSTASLAARGNILNNADVYMPITPMFHVHAWGIPYAATALGIKQVYPGRYEPGLLLDLIKEENVTFSHCIPTILQMLIGSPNVKEVDLSNWKVIIGGSTLPRGLARSALDLGIEVYSGYGLSETCPVLALTNFKPENATTDREGELDVRTSTGLPMPLVDLRLVDYYMNFQPHDGQATGEIVARSPWMTQSYFKSPEKGRDLWKGGYLHTGDVALINPDGYVRITGRIKDVIKTGGEWISSLELENLISQHPAVAEVAVVGIPDEKWGERPVAMVVPARPEDAEDFPMEELRQFLMEFVEKGVISKFSLPDRIDVVDYIPKTSVGKLDKKIIRRQI